MTFKPGDKVEMKYGDKYYEGEVTIVREDNHTCKVIFTDTDCPLDYWYYPMRDLELVERKTKDA